MNYKEISTEELIRKYKIKRCDYNRDQLEIPNGNKLAQDEIALLKSNKQNILDYFDMLEKEAKEKRVKEYQNMIDNNTILNLSLLFHAGMTAIVCLPPELKDSEKIIVDNIEFNIDPYYGDYGKSYLDIGLADLIKKIKEVEKELETKEVEKENKNKEYYNKKLAEAKEKNEKVVFTIWSDECNDPEEECNIDNITKYLYPDGTYETVRTHTW